MKIWSIIFTKELLFSYQIIKKRSFLFRSYSPSHKFM